MYKLHITKSITPDTISLSDSILTINSVDYDLNNLDADSSKPVYKQDAIYETDDNGDVTDEILQDEMIHIRLVVPEKRMFMFVKVYGVSNLYRFFDIDDNGIIDLEELQKIVDYINEEDDDKLKADLKEIRDSYLAIEGNTVKTWNHKGLS